MADKNSSRNTKFNYYTEGNTIHTISDYKAGKKDTKINLLEYKNYIKVTGEDIIKDANKNPNKKDLKSKDTNPKIDVEDIDDKATYYIYGSPEKWVLDNRQQYNNCGVDSVLNTLVMAGLTTITNQNKTEKNFTQKMLDKGLCEDNGTYGYLDILDGGTSIEHFKAILNTYGIATTTYHYESENEKGDKNGCDIETFAKAIVNGKCAIVAVCADLLWGRETYNPELNHAICVTGVVLNKISDHIDYDSDIQGFYIHDTGGWATRYISLGDFLKITFYDDEIKEGEKHGVFAAITDDAVKIGTNDINATGNSLANTIIGNSGNNLIKGMGGNDTINGGYGDDTIYGGSGNDLINDDYGNDRLYGDNGNDTIYGDNGNDIIYGGSGNDLIYGGNDYDRLYGDNGNDTIYGDKGNDVINGGNGNDLIYGGNGNDSLDGGSGNDTIYDNDSLDGGNGNDIIYGGAGNDAINGGAGKDSLFGGTGNDTIYGGSGNDYIKDNKGKNVIYGDAGNDSINTSEATEGQLIYGDDKNYKVTGNDTIRSGSKDDTIYSGKGNDFIYSGDGNDSIVCYSGNNYIEAENGNDTIKCGNGKDTINGGEGDDSIICGGGNDTIIMNTNWGNDTIESISGRNTLKFESSDKNKFFARNFDFLVDDNGHLIINSGTNSVDYSNFYDTKLNGYWPVYLEDDQYKYNVSCNMTTTSAESYLKLKVENSKGNNILLTKDNNTNITTSKYADIVYMDNENDTITYTGGQDYYYSTSGDDQYVVKTFNSKTDLEINDKQSTNDTIIIQTNKDNINLFFDVTKNGCTTLNTNLTIFSNGEIEDIINNPYGITIDNYFTSETDISSEIYKGDGCIENVHDSLSNLNINKAVQDIANSVAQWLNGKAADSAYSVMMGTDIVAKQDLLALYMSYDIQYT